MKTLRKYATMAFLLISATTIIPTFGNPTVNEQEKVKQEEIVVEPKKTEKTAWYNKKIGNTQATIAGIAGYISFLASVSAVIWYTGLWKGILPVKQPCIICKDNEFHREIAKICTKYGVEKYHLIF